MSKHSRFIPFVVVAVALAVFIGLSWTADSSAQSPLSKMKGGSVGATKAAFRGILNEHGNLGMMLEVHIRVAGPHVDEVQHIGKFIESTDSFLTIKLQNGRDLIIIPWEHVLWIQARPSA